MWYCALLCLPIVDNAESLQFVSERARFWVGRSTTVAVQVDEPEAVDRDWSVTSSDPLSLRVLEPARILAGETIGFARVQALATGSGTLSLLEETLPWSCQPLVESSKVREPVPVIVGPVSSAHVWGLVAVGVELPLGVARAEDYAIELEVVGVGRFTPTRHVATRRDPGIRVLFELDTAELPPGPTILRAIASLEGRDWVGEDHSIAVVHPARGEVLDLELESTVATPRPEGYGEAHPSIAGDPSASEGRAVVARRYDPLVIAGDLPLVPGRWQVMARVRGDLGAGAFPTVALTLDGPGENMGSARVLDRRWHRVPIGPPLVVTAPEPGSAGENNHVLGLRHFNSIDVGPAERRDLYLDRLECLRLSEGGGGSSGMSMQGMQQGSMQGQSMEMSSEESAGLPGKLWIGALPIVDGASVHSTLKIEGLCNWSERGTAPVPVVELLIDGEVRAQTQTDQPIFRVQPAEFGPGEHTIVLRATQPGGLVAQTPEQVVSVPPGVDRDPLRREHRIALRAKGWHQTGDNESIDLNHPQQVFAAQYDLPEEWSGRFAVRVDARGPGSPQAGQLSGRLVVPGSTPGEEDQLLLKTDWEIQNWWREYSFGEIDLPEGPKRLVLSGDPGPVAGNGLTELHLRSFIFEQMHSAPDHHPPSARILYPEPGATLHGLQALVVEVLDDRSVDRVQLFVDGRPTPTFGRVHAGLGTVLVPLFTDKWSLGEHLLHVRVLDESHNQGESAELRVHVVAAEEAPPDRLRRAVHLVNRMGLGPDTRELAQILVDGEAAWIEDELTIGAGHRSARAMSDARLGPDIPYGARQLALRVALMTDHPIAARFAFVVDNHFNTWSGKTGVPAEWGDHKRYLDLGFAPFAELLFDAATSPVMLRYLDQATSFRGRLNENFARELLELHCLGVGNGYDQSDVTALAGLLCGLTVTEEGPMDGAGQYRALVFRYAPDLADATPADLLGRRFACDQVGDRQPDLRAGYERLEALLEHLAAHPNTARHWATKLAEHYVSVPAPERLVEDLAQVFLETGGDSRELLRAIATHPEFWDGMHKPRLATPFDFAMRIARTSRPQYLQGHVDTYMQQSGMGLFDHEAPDGYSFEDDAWVDSNALLARWNFVNPVPWATRAWVPEVDMANMTTDGGRYGSNAIDHAAFALLGGAISDQSKAELLQYLRDLPEREPWKVLEHMTQFLTRTPEANLR